MKSHKIYFRLTEEEYDRLQEACEASGIETISELIRAALDNLVGIDEAAGNSQLHRLRSRVRLLTLETELLAQHVKQAIPPVQHKVHHVGALANGDCRMPAAHGERRCSPRLELAVSA